MKKKVLLVICAVAVLVGACAASSFITRALVKPEVVYVGGNSEGSTDYDFIHEIFNNPENYFGKEITLTGYYSNSDIAEGDSDTDSTETSSSSVAPQKIYHFLTVFDNYKDCFLTVEFTTSNDKYPDVGEYFTLTGTFGKYTEDDGTYFNIDVKEFHTVA